MNNKALAFTITNALLFQVGWFVCILCGSFWAVIFTLSAIVFHFSISRQRLDDVVRVPNSFPALRRLGVNTPRAMPALGLLGLPSTSTARTGGGRARRRRGLLRGEISACAQRFCQAL